MDSITPDFGLGLFFAVPPGFSCPFPGRGEARVNIGIPDFMTVKRMLSGYFPVYGISDYAIMSVRTTKIRGVFKRSTSVRWDG